MLDFQQVNTDEIPHADSVIPTNVEMDVTFGLAKAEQATHTDVTQDVFVPPIVEPNPVTDIGEEDFLSEAEDEDNVADDIENNLHQ